MILKKINMALIAALIGLSSNAFAGSEDWNGTFNIRAVDGKEYTVFHTPKFVRFMFIQTGICMMLTKGSTINGLKMPETVNLCTNQHIDDFSKELEKFSVILKENIEIGPNYSIS